MTWIHRLQCAVEVSQACLLHHCAHRATNEAIVHGDNKSANILFDGGAAKPRTLAWRAWRATSSTR